MKYIKTNKKISKFEKNYEKSINEKVKKINILFAQGIHEKILLRILHIRFIYNYSESSY